MKKVTIILIGGDHPCMCGDYVVVVLVLPSGLGSPPRVQGLPLLGDVLVTPSRITPACAGTTGPGAGK